MARYADTEDAKLLSRTREDPEAFGAFYDRHVAALLAFFWRATRRAEVAADLTAETFAQALASARGFNPARGTPKAWLFGIARHQLADTWERGRVEDQARQRLGVEPLALSDETLERIESLGGRGGPEALELLAGLPADQRRAVQGRVLEERDYHELAQTLDCSESVVRQRVSRGLRSLRERLEGIYLPELRASLVRAAAREVATPRSRRSGLGWLAPAVAAGVALAVVAVAIVLIGHRAPGGGSPPAHPTGAAPPPMPNLSGSEWNLIVKARRATVAHDAVCSPFVGPRPAIRPGRPSRELTAILGVLRQPASAADTAPLKYFQHGPFDVYGDAIRLAHERDGVGLYVVPTANVNGWRPVPRRCAGEEAAALYREMNVNGASAKRTAAALDGQRRYLAWQEYEAEHPQGVCLAEVDSVPHNGSHTGGVGCGWGVPEIEHGLAALGHTGSPGPSLFHGIVPDGVASVVLELPGHRGTVTARVVNNVYLAPFPRSVQAPARVLWRSADDRLIRTTRVP